MQTSELCNREVAIAEKSLSEEMTELAKLVSNERLRVLVLETGTGQVRNFR